MCDTIMYVQSTQKNLKSKFLLVSLKLLQTRFGGLKNLFARTFYRN